MMRDNARCQAVEAEEYGKTVFAVFVEKRCSDIYAETAVADSHNIIRKSTFFLAIA
jgi:hypothetical protein